MAEDFTGYDVIQFGESDKQYAADNSIEFCYSAPEERHHKSIDPRPFLKVENQLAIGSCTGNSITTCCEYVAGCQLGDFAEVPQLSRWAAYYWGRELFGNLNQDGGCSIQSSVEAVKTIGACLESVVPYPPRFNTNPLPAGAREDAAKRKINSTIVPGNYEDVINFLDGGFGSIQIGVLLSNAMKNTGDWTLANVKEDGSRGGHAIAIVGFLENGDIIVANSWSLNWGHKGYMIMTKDACNYLIDRPYSAFIGISDLTGFDTVRILKSHRGAG